MVRLWNRLQAVSSQPQGEVTDPGISLTQLGENAPLESFALPKLFTEMDGEVFQIPVALDDPVDDGLQERKGFFVFHFSAANL